MGKLKVGVLIAAMMATSAADALAAEVGQVGADHAARPPIVLAPPYNPATPAAPEEHWTPQITTFNAAQRAQVAVILAHGRKVLDAYMVDYPSARFRNVRAVYNRPQAKAPTICGLVNAKTRFGGYGGWKVFMLVEDHASIEPDILWDICARQAYLTDTHDYTDAVAPKP